MPQPEPHSGTPPSLTTTGAQSAAQSAAQRKASARAWRFRLAAIGLGLSVFVVTELVCRLFGWGAMSVRGGHVAELASDRPLFVLSDDDSTYRIAENRRDYFAEESFPADRSADDYRIFVIGGSTVQGRPFSIQTAFAKCLEMCLQRATDRSGRVINCGGISYASYRLVPIVAECLRYEPDLIIICTGHNEFLEFTTYAAARRARSVAGAYRLLDRLYSFRLIERGLTKLLRTEAARPPSGDEVSLPQEVDALLDHQGGLAAYRRSELDRQTVETGFYDQLQQMLDLAAAAEVPVILVRPPANLADCPPFKSEFSASTTPEQQDRFRQRLADASSGLSTGDPMRMQRAVTELQTLTQQDPGYALAWYQLGRALLNGGRVDEATVAFQRACDEDICPLRMTTSLDQELRQIVNDRDVPFLDAHQLLTERSRRRIVDDSVLVDHVHPSFQSHLAIAVALVELLEQQQWMTISRSSWKSDTQQDFSAHLQTLDDMYYLRGRQMLDVLEAWAAGRADGSPLSQEPSTRPGH